LQYMYFSIFTSANVTKRDIIEDRYQQFLVGRKEVCWLMEWACLKAGVKE